MAGRTLTTADADRHAADIAERGYTVIEDALDRELVDRLLADLDRLHDELAVQPAENGFEGTATIKRSDWGLGTFVPMVSDEVELQITTAFEKQ